MTDRVSRLAAERRMFTPGPNGPLSVCLVYPNTYPVAMANLGFQAVYRLLAADSRGGTNVGSGSWPSRANAEE